MNSDVKTIIKYLTILDLPLDKTISQEIVKAQYRKLAKIYHPDAHQDIYSDGEKFKQLNEAKEYCIAHIDEINHMIEGDFKEGNQNSFNSSSESFERQTFKEVADSIKAAMFLFGLSLNRTFTINDLNNVRTHLMSGAYGNNTQVHLIETNYLFLKSNLEVTKRMILADFDYANYQRLIAEEERKKREKEEADRRAKEQERLRQEQAKKEHEQKLKAIKEKFKNDVRAYYDSLSFSYYDRKAKEQIDFLKKKYINKAAEIGSQSSADYNFNEYKEAIKKVPNVQQRKKIKKRRIILGISFGLVFTSILATVITLGSIQAYNANKTNTTYLKAGLLMEAGDYVQAAYLLNGIRNYKDSQRRIFVSSYLKSLKNKILNQTPASEDQLKNLSKYCLLDVTYKTNGPSFEYSYTTREFKYSYYSFHMYEPRYDSRYLLTYWKHTHLSYSFDTNTAQLDLLAVWHKS